MTNRLDDNMKKIELYKNNVEALEAQLQPLQKTSTLYSSLRLASVVLAIALSIYADQSGKTIGFVLAIALLILFIALVIMHGKLQKQIRLLMVKQHVYTHFIARMDGEWKKEAALRESDNSVSADLDIVGQRSLFTYLNMCATPYGEDVLEGLLLNQDLDIEQISKRQEVVKELLEHNEFLLDIQCSSHMFREDRLKLNRETFDFLITYGKEQKILLSPLLNGFSKLMTGSVLLLLIVGFFDMRSWYVCFGVASINCAICLLFYQRFATSLAFTKNLERIMKDFNRMFETMKNENVKSAGLQEIKEQMHNAVHGVQALRRVMIMIDMRHNLISYLVGSSLFLLDFRCVHALEKWRKQYGNALEQWIVAVGKLEAYASLCVIAQTKEETCFASLLEQEQPAYACTAMIHPLLQEQQAVANDIRMEAGTIIVTGSNMSGKTTFLRTLGMNMILTLAGAPVCAQQLSCTPLKVYTSMRVQDDVREGISTFYAELLRIRMMMQDSKQEKPMLVLIDEIFKGTNSADRILCAKTAIERLHLPWVITMVSTHDFELCALQQDPHIQACNYHFEEFYEGDEIHFDYRLKKGKCTTTNAQQLMRLAGF